MRKIGGFGQAVAPGLPVGVDLHSGPLFAAGLFDVAAAAETLQVLEGPRVAALANWFLVVYLQTARLAALPTAVFVPLPNQATYQPPPAAVQPLRESHQASPK